MIILKSPHEIECIRKASKLTADTLSLLVKKAKPGITTLELDTIAEEYTKPLIDYYRNSGLYEEINGLQDVDAVFADIIKALEK